MLPLRSDSAARRRTSYHTPPSVLKSSTHQLPLPYNPLYVLLAVGLVMISVVGIFFLFGGPVQSGKPQQAQSTSVPVLVRYKKGDSVLEVLEDRQKGYRLLRSNKCILGGSWLADGSTIFVHNAIQAAAIYLRSLAAVQQKNYLVIGLGTGHVASYLHLQGWRGDVVEINPKIVEYANKFFRFEGTGKVFLEDGSTTALRMANTHRYSLVIQDVFDGKLTPHIHTKQMFERARGILAHGGVYVVNVFTSFCCSLERTMLARSVLVTLHQVFENVHAYYDGGALDDPANIVFFASELPLVFDTDALHEDTPLEVTVKSFHKKWEHHPKLMELENSARGSAFAAEIITDDNKHLIGQWNQIAIHEYEFFLPKLFPNISWT